MKTSVLLYLILSVSIVSGAVDLYLEPEVSGTPIATVELTNPALSLGSAVLDESKAELGWKWAEYRQTMTGYVPDAKIGKDLLPVEGAIVRREPSENSAVLTTVELGDEIEIVDNGAWWTIAFTKAIPVYYIEESPAAEVPVLIDPGVSASALELEDDELLAENRSEPAVTSLLDVYQSNWEEEQTERAAKNPAFGLSHAFEGIFQRATPTLGIFEPKKAFLLMDDQGRRIGWVDLSELVIPGSLNKYLGQSVIINGGRSFDPKGREMIIHARNMRLK